MPRSPRRLRLDRPRRADEAAFPGTTKTGEACSDRPKRPAPGPGLSLGRGRTAFWFCGFFNYADRQALSAVFPLLKGEFGISDAQLGTLSSAFMLLYALTSPFTGYTVDIVSRRFLIAAGLAFWSIICASTALARNFVQLVVFRAAEGIGESFYFPASMSVLADYHWASDTVPGDERPSDERVHLGTAGATRYPRAASWASLPVGGPRSGAWAWRAWSMP